MDKDDEELKKMFKKEVLALVEEKDHTRVEVTRVGKSESTGALSIDFLVHPRQGSKLTPTSLVAKFAQTLDDHADPKTDPNLLLVGTKMLSNVEASSYYTHLHPSAADLATFAEETSQFDSLTKWSLIATLLTLVPLFATAVWKREQLRQAFGCGEKVLNYELKRQLDALL